jgi:hypothetical protein
MLYSSCGKHMSAAFSLVKELSLLPQSVDMSA